MQHAVNGQMRVMMIEWFVLLLSFARNPLIIASVAGFLFNYLDLEMNIAVHKTLNSLSDAGLAMGLINVGAGLSFTISSVYIQRILFTGLIKLCVLPIVTAGILTLFMIGDESRAVCMLYSALPCASTAYILSKQMGGDSDLMAAIITATTVFSVFTISAVMWWVG